jgi:hypothetical protein
MLEWTISCALDMRSAIKMNSPLDSLALYRATLAPQSDGFDAPREVLRQSFLSFRDRVADLVSTLGSELPNLTVHDITHLDALWRIAHEIAGSEYSLNPAEAYVLGGAFLLHDAAHVLAAYPGRLNDIKKTVHWQDFIAQRCGGTEPAAGSSEENATIFQVLRHLHGEQAHRLPSLSWPVGAGEDRLYLIEHYDLRSYYGDLIGEVASSHHWSPGKVAERFKGRRVSCPSFLAPASWEVDALKVALLLRTADAAHLDAARAPWFLFALRQPQGVSADHWRFQAKLGQPKCTAAGELRFTSGASFSSDERAAWWLAFDTVRMVDRELRNANEILREEGRAVFRAHRVLGAESTEMFAKQVPVHGWEPIDVSPRISDATRLIASLGGAALYGESYAAPLRELLQNALDAVCALRSLGGLGADEGEVHIGISSDGDGGWWLEVTDTGIGMSRYVLANVLLDFGSSLWASDAMREELPGLAKTNFKAVGKFGIGFFSIFMLGSEVRVTTRRFEPIRDENKVNWQLRFDDGLMSRPALIQPSREEALSRPGTRVAVKVTDAKLELLLGTNARLNLFADIFEKRSKSLEEIADERSNHLAWLVASLCPASAVRITTKLDAQTRYLVVAPADWETIPDERLLNRVTCEGRSLQPLLEGGGLIGRVGFDSSSYPQRPGSIVYGGVVCGQMRGLAGAVRARENNNDARRAKATPAGTLDAWRAWAKLQLADSALGVEELIRLHPLFPELDLAVWNTGKGDLTLAQILDRYENASELLLHSDSVSHDDADDLSSDRFKNYFTPASELVCCPSFKPIDSVWSFAVSVPGSGKDAFPWFLEVPPIDYEERFKAELEKRWGVLECDEDTFVVGDVDGIEITRMVSKYCRVLA